MDVGPRFLGPQRMPRSANLRGLGHGVEGFDGLGDPDPGTDLGSNGQPIVGYDFYIYESDITTGIAAGATVNSFIAIDAQSDFLWVKGTFFADIAQAAQTANTLVLPLCTIQLLDNASQRPLFSNPVPVPSVFGIGQVPYILPQPRIFSAQSQIQLTIVNFSAGTTYNLRLSLQGVKRFLGGGNRL